MKDLPNMLCIVVMLVLCSYTTLNKKNLQLKRIVIDAGHGGKDPGALGRISQEKEVALQIANGVAALLKTHLEGIEVIYTRRNNDEFVELRERARIANREHADLFVSIHCNASTVPTVKGTETYVLGLSPDQVAQRENAAIQKEANFQSNYEEDLEPNSPAHHILYANYQLANQKNSLMVAQMVEYQFRENLRRQSHGVKQSSFIVLWKTAMPSVLIEVGFLTNEEEETFLNAKKGSEDIAYNIFEAIRKYKIQIEKP